MKKLHLILLLVTVTLSCLAQTVGEAFYIYRNDGEFNAFFRDEVDSIAYSNYDTDSIYFEEAVMQVVYTQDSIYRIPLAAIDSVGFVQPETILQPNVVIMAQKGLIDYLRSVDGMSLLFDKSMPQELMPKVGEVLLYTDFDNPILNEGFVGKVLQSRKEKDVILVECDSIYDLFDVFEQLISIEKITDTKENVKSRRRVDGEWISSRNTCNFNLGFSRDLPGKDNTISLSGSLDGTYIAKIIYCMTRKKQYFSLWVDHDWQYGAHLNFKHEGNRDPAPMIGAILSLPAIRFPAIAPVFMFQISGAPFAKLDGNVEIDFSLNSPKHSYVTRFEYKNGIRSWWNHRKNLDEDDVPSIEISGSLDGSIHAGCMVDFWLGLDLGIKGIAKASLKLGTGLDFYIGPKANGNFTLKAGTDNPVNIYSLFKDSKLSMSLLTVDYEFFGEAALGGVEQAKHVFCNGTIESPLRHEWYLLPEFSDLSIYKNENDLSATITCEPTRDILFPMSVGIGLYNSSGALDNFAYQTPNYKHENEGFLINQKFESLTPNKEYNVKPIIKFLGMNVPASPSERFTLNHEMSPTKITNFEVNNAAFVREGFEYKNKTYYYDFAATTTIELENSEGVEDWGYVYKDPDGEKVHISVKDLGKNIDSRYNYYRKEPKSTATLYGYAKDHNGKYYYDVPKEYDLLYVHKPSGYVKDAFDVTTTSAQFEYGFDDVPLDAKCFVAVQTGNRGTYSSYAVTDTAKDTLAISNLQPSTTYTYWAYVEYDGKTYSAPDGKKSFTTNAPPPPIATTGDVSKITKNSANVVCTYANVPDNGVCGVVYKWKDGSAKQTAKSSNGTQNITLSGLASGTTYTYRAYIEANGQTYYGEEKTFTTESDLPNVTGSWNCKEYYNDRLIFETTFVLNADGTVKSSKDVFDNVKEGTWSPTKEGKVYIGFSFNSDKIVQRKDYTGTLDKSANPSRIEGSATVEWFSYVNGRNGGSTYRFVMTR